MQIRHAEKKDCNITRESVGRILVIAMGLFFLLARSQVAYAGDVRIWDNDISNWTMTFASGDPIDTDTANSALEPQIAVDSNGVVYVTYRQSDGAQDHIYLSRYNGTDVRIWDNDTSRWTTILANGDPIDTGTANDASVPQIAVDSNGVVYVTYRQSDGAKQHIYLSRYDGTDVRIWDNDTSGWTTTLANGDPIDTGTANDALEPQIAIASNGLVYITYTQSDGANYHIYLSRYDGTDVRIRDNDTSSWTTAFANGDPIDTGAGNAHEPQIAVDSNGVVYVTYYQHDGANQHIYLSRYDGADVRIWDNDTSGWTTTLANGDPIDPGTANDAWYPRLAVDSNGVVYIAYTQIHGAQDHIHLSRYDGTDVRIWDNDTFSWTTTFADGDPIDTGTANNAYAPQLAVDSNGVVYVTYYQHDGANQHIYLSRYDGTDVRIWDNDTSSWTTTFADGDPIDTGTANDATTPQIAIASNGVVYVTYRQSDGVQNHICFSRYDARAVATAGSGGGGGCFIATAAYGSSMDPHVKILRDFRDRFLFNNPVGKGFIHLYYTYSPSIAAFIKPHDSLKAVVRVGLLPFVGISWMVLKIGPITTTAFMVILISCLSGFVWLRRGYKE